MSPSIPILVVDDYESWRNQVRLLLQARPEWQVICEVSDGAEAIHKGKELQPDVILLDIGLPKLNGIEAARRIRQLAPNSKIVFLSQENSPDIVEEALNAGAQGFVHKQRAQDELLPAIDAALRWKRFFSGMLEDDNFTDTLVTKGPVGHAEVTSERATKRIFQIAYTHRLRIDRARLLRRRGYAVMSAMGNKAAQTLLTSLHCDDRNIALFIVGHAAPPQTRREMVDWLKANYPGVKILALTPPNQKVRGVDYNALQNGPEI